MVQTLEALRKRINSAQDLQSIVTTMKAIAAVNIRHAEKAVASLEEYNRTVEMGLQILLRNSEPRLSVERPKPLSRIGAIIFGSDQGLVGQFNRVITNHALAEMDRLQVPREDRTVLVVGLRTATILELEGHPIHQTLTVPASIPQITLMLQEIVIVIERWRQVREIEHLMLYYNHPESGISYRPVSLQLLPIDLNWLESLRSRPWESRSLPIFTADPNQLFSTLVREYFLVSLFAAFARSMASENASRLASMQAAEKNIEDKLTELTNQYNQFRQTSITEEILDIIAGFEALTGAT
jgi:F-type H+-transporting ATPase subunit gamma